MKQKVVIRVQMEDDKKRAKAMKKAVGLPGVLSAAIGSEKNQIIVIGDGVDSVTLTTLLRKHMGFAELISVAGMEEKKDDKKQDKKEDIKQPDNKPAEVWSYYHGGGGYPPQYAYVGEVRDHYQQVQDPCSIM